METKLVTVEDYANMHEVSVVTVRQWIRRGKIRKARKFGSEWRIPEFIEPVSGKYQDVIFVWGSNKLTNLSPEYEYLNEYREIAITQADSDTYKAALSNHTSSQYRLIRLNTREREKLELWMKIGYRDHIVTNEEISCTGCKPENWCRYRVVKCCEDRGIETCADCGEYPCNNMKDCFEGTRSFMPKCREVCTDEEYQQLNTAFFEKEKNLSAEG